MKELIRIEKVSIGDNEVSAVSARELYIGLGLDQSHWSRWHKENIDESEYFTQGIDFIQLAIKASADTPRPPKDFAISIDFAKHIAMQARTEKSHEYRNYMLECEKKALILSLPDFTNPAIAARAWADEVEAKQIALQQVESQKVSLVEKDKLIVASNEASIKAGEILVREFVKSVDIIDIGQNEFYDWMREQGFLLENKREPDQRYVKLGYFTYKPTDARFGGEVRYTLRITPRGKVWLAAKYMAHLDTKETV